jgi:para-nitrobenzyl esterase
MIWWHGGGFQSGSGAVYDAGRLAREGRVVVVTVNYRLGIFGYLGLPGLRGGGTFGLADQVLATRWAKRNARALGGDPHRVTVFGQSAGAMSACGLLTAPAARGLVDRVALSSGSCALDWPAGAQFAGTPAARPYVSRAQSSALGTSTAKALGCSGPATIDCLRAKPVAELLPASQEFGNALAYGTPLLPRDPRRAVRQGRVARIPVLSGGVRDEERAFQGGAAKADPSIFSAAAYPGLLHTAYGRDAARVAARYSLGAFPSPLYAFAAATTDGSWSCPTLRADRALARHGVRVYGFEFADRGAPDVNGVDGPGFTGGAAHATDVPYLFDLAGESLLTTSAQRLLARVMVRAWTSFARTGRPSGAGARPWRPMTRRSVRVRQLAPGALRGVDAARRHDCDLWDAVAR